MDVMTLGFSPTLCAYHPCLLDVNSLKGARQLALVSHLCEEIGLQRKMEIGNLQMRMASRCVVLPKILLISIYKICKKKKKKVR